MDFSPKVACICGGNGISGRAMIDALIEQPYSEWSRIICISRRPTQLDIHDERIYFIVIDIMASSIVDIVTELSKADGEMITHVYYYMYVENDDEEQLNEINEKFIRKMLDVMIEIAANQIKCITLQTDYRYYGVHKGGQYLAARPYTEEITRYKGCNLYFTQEDLVKEYSKKYNWKYIITRSNIIVGISKGNSTNFLLCLAKYACIQKENGQPLIFPGNEKAWNSVIDHSDARNNARFQIWLSTNESIRDEIFNISNGDEMRFRSLWPKLEEYFGFSPHKQTFHNSENIRIGDINVLQLSLEDHIPKHKGLWEKIVKFYQLDGSIMDSLNWKYADSIFGRTFNDHGSMRKAQEYGWTTIIPTDESYIRCFDELKHLNVIP